MSASGGKADMVRRERLGAVAGDMADNFAVSSAISRRRVTRFFFIDFVGQFFAKMFQIECDGI